MGIIDRCAQNVFDDAARVFSEVLGREIRHVRISPERAKQGMLRRGWSPRSAELIVEMWRRGQPTYRADLALEDPHGDDHAWFMCYAPATEPQVALDVILENAGHGGAEAAPVAAFDTTSFPPDPETYNDSTATTVYDSLGTAHTMTYFYRKMPDDGVPNSGDENLWRAAERHLVSLPDPRAVEPGNVLLFRMRDLGVAKHLAIAAERNAASGSRSRMSAMRRRKRSPSPHRRIRRSNGLLTCCSDRSKYGTPVSQIASISGITDLSPVRR